MKINRTLDSLSAALAAHRHALAQLAIVTAMVLLVATGSLIPTALAPQPIELKLRSYATQLEAIRRADGQYPPVFAAPSDQVSYRRDADGFVLCLPGKSGEAPATLNCWHSRTSSILTAAPPVP
jgi:hypothetical protein